jgi:hypothetical protein
MAQEEPCPNEEPVPNYQQALSDLSYPELLSALDLALLELEKRLYRYAKVGPELLKMADEGLVLAARAKARLGRSLSAAQHAEGHLQVVGVGDWKPSKYTSGVERRTPADGGGLLTSRIGSHWV